MEVSDIFSFQISDKEAAVKGPAKETIRKLAEQNAEQKSKLEASTTSQPVVTDDTEAKNEKEEVAMVPHVFDLHC